MKTYCVLCHRKHNATNWRCSEYQTVDGMRTGWFCSKWYKPSASPEAIPERIKTDRNKYAKSLLQPFRGGTASSEYIQAYGSKNFTNSDVAKAKPVWKDILPSNWERSK